MTRTARLHLCLYNPRLNIFSHLPSKNYHRCPSPAPSSSSFYTPCSYRTDSQSSSRSPSRSPSTKSTEYPTKRMPTKAPASLNLRWHIALVFLTLFIFILGISVAFCGVVIMEESLGDRLKQLGGVICFALGIVLGFFGFFFLIDCSINFAVDCERYMKGLKTTN